MEYNMSNLSTATATAQPSRAPSVVFEEDEKDGVTVQRRNVGGSSTPHESYSAMGSSSGAQTHASQPAYFHSRRVKKGEIEKPWVAHKNPKEKWVTIIPLIGIAVGLCFAALLVWDGLSSVVNHDYCPVYEEDFSNGLDPKIWTKEVELGGYGNGQFEETTGGDENSFIKDGHLYIKPTLQNASLIQKNSVIDLRQGGLCTSNNWYDCLTSTNTTNGTIVNPVKSARLNTKLSKFIKYGRVEVEAKLPAGDWLWPAIWMMPVKDTYGPWPASGEIDIMESRGNDYTYPQGGNNIVSSTLHWGPTPALDRWWMNNNKRTGLHTTYASSFHTFGLEWSEKYLFTYIGSRLLTVLYTTFDTPLWKEGNFGIVDGNGTALVDPWSQTGHDSTPFDQDFYLIISLAVGATNGWFEDGVNGKPWVDASPSAKLEFWRARHRWYPTWKGNDEMVIRRVRMWQQAGYNGCKVKGKQ